MEKLKIKMLALSVLSMARILFGSSKKATFAIDVATELVTDKWDEGWDTYSKKVAAKGVE